MNPNSSEKHSGAMPFGQTTSIPSRDTFHFTSSFSFHKNDRLTNDR